MKTLILAEKPSVGRNIADALKCKTRHDGYLEGEDHIITWAFGHLLTLYDCKDYDKSMEKWDINKFPYIPQHFKYKVKTQGGYNSKIDTGAKKQLNIIKSLIDRNDVDRIITATDFDREGELISTLIYQYINVEKPVYRILINEWTEDEIRRGLNKLKTNDEMLNLQSAGISRQWLDWVIGINFTTVSTLKYARGKGNVLNVGRVLMPTLKMVYDREMEIEKFNSQKYYELYINFKAKNGKYKGKFFHDKLEKFPKRESVEKLKNEIDGKDGTVISIDEENKKEIPPVLFNMTNLQGYMTSKHKGWTADKALKVAQSLYEKKLITYPRTSSTALEESLKDKAKKVLDVHKKGLSCEKEIIFSESKRIFNNDKVESHSAIIPTYIIPRVLTPDEQKLYDAIKERFLVQFMEAAEFKVTEVITIIKGEKFDRLFKTKGKVMAKEGYLKLSSDKKKKDEILISLDKDETVKNISSKIEEKSTKPPAHHTEKTLLKAMETCGKNRSSRDEDDKEEEASMEVLKGYSIGTAATRAEIIKKLKDTKYIKTQGKSLLITEKGKKLVEIFPIKELLDTDYTGRMEKALYDIEKGKLDQKTFLDYIFKFTFNGVQKIKRDRFITIGVSENIKKETKQS